MVDKDKKEKSDKKKSYKKVKKVKKTKGKLRLFKRKLRFIRKYKLKEKDEELGYPDGIYQKVFKICCIHPIGVLAGVYYSSSIATILATVLATMLSLSSINYWRNPLVSSIRRTIDMIVAFTAISYHIYLSLSTTNKILCLGLILLGAMMYPISLVINHCGYHQIGYIFHCLIHVFVMIGAIFTYRDYYIRKKNAELNI
jgi:hypothetical protein